MKISYKSLVAAVALAMGGTASADIIDTGSNAPVGRESNVIVSVYNITGKSSTVLNTGLTLSDFRDLNAADPIAGGPSTPKTTPDQSWKMDLSGLSIQPTDQVEWMLGAGHLDPDFRYGLLSTVDNNFVPRNPANLLGRTSSNFQPATQQFDAYVDSITQNPTVNFTVVTGSNSPAGEQSRVFVSSDTFAYSGYSWGDNWGNGVDFNATNLLGQSSDVYFTSFVDGVGSMATYDPLMSASLASDGTFALSAVSAVPVPAAAWLFGSGLVGLVGVARRRKQ